MGALRDEFLTNGIVAQSFALSNLDPLPGLKADAAGFERDVQKMRAQNQYSVPYKVTDAIQAVAHDPTLVQVVQEVLGTSDWVMWGANVRDGTPNEAHAWHVDIESAFWPSITVAIGVSGCTPGNATQVIPGSQRAPIPALEAVDMTNDAAVMAAARGQDFSVAEPVTAQGFGDGRFFVFDARAWHAGVPHQSNNRCVLFTHFHPAKALRVPQLRDYREGTFYRHAAPFIDGSGRANPKVALGPYVGKWARLAARFGLY